MLKAKIQNLANILNLPIQILKKNINQLFGNLGVSSLVVSQLRDILSPKPSYQELYGLTITQIIERLPVPETKKSIYRSQSTSQKVSDLQPFPLTPMQESYVLGSSQGCPCQVYTEFDSENLDIELFKEAVKLVVNQHSMLHAIIFNNTFQKILPENEWNNGSNIDFDLKLSPKKQREVSLGYFKNHPNSHWRIALSKVSSKFIRIHLLLDMLFIDAISTLTLIHEVAICYNSLHSGQKSFIPMKPKLHFQDYCIQRVNQAASPLSTDYWKNKVRDFPGPPQLPSLPKKTSQVPNFSRESTIILKPHWDSLKKLARKLNITPNALLITVFSEVLRYYSEEPNFSVPITMSERPSSPENDFSGVVGEFTNVLLCPCYQIQDDSLENKAIKIHQELIQALENSDFSGLDVIRLLRKTQSDPYLSFPIVFTSFLDIIDSNISLNNSKIKLHYQQTQTPQIALDHQVYEFNESLYINWDYDTNVYSHDLIFNMLSCFAQLLESIAKKTSTSPRLPSKTLKSIEKLNLTECSFESHSPLLLHELITRTAKKFPQSTAVIDQELNLTYQDVIEKAYSVAALLKKAGVKKGSCVAILMEKGWEQVVGCLGILLAGGYYLPLNPSHPKARLSQILSLANCLVTLVHDRTQSAAHSLHDHKDLAKISLLNVNQLVKNKESGRNFKLSPLSPDELAYVIFTSGSTGTPKGVEITHRSAANTCLDINKHFSLKEKTVTFAISSLSFDLSVWDIFGTLASGGTIIICKPNGTKDPDYWWEQIQKHQVTVWNTVPTSFEMLIASKPPEVDIPIKITLLSGDAFKMSTAESIRKKFPKLKIIVLGGATEASIWSNYHIVTNQSIKMGTELVPYGRALSNQSMYVLDSEFRYRPPGVVGEIYIGGIGLSQGYFHDKQLAEAKFIKTKHFGRIYETGDLGRYLPNGEIEIIGRKDSQVKIGGNRVELNEIEKCIDLLPFVKRSAIIHVPGSNSRLIGYVSVSEKSDARKKEIHNHVESNLPDYMVPQTWVLLDELPLTSNHKVDKSKLAKISIIPTNGESFSQSVVNRNDISLILKLAGQVLEVPPEALSPTQNLAEQGLSSLQSVRLINLLSEAWGKRLSYTLLFNYPSALQLANYHCSSESVNKSSKQKLINTPTSTEPIAIISIACRLPNNVRSPEEFWQMLASSTDCMINVPFSRFDIDEIFCENPETPGHSYSKKGAFMDQVDSFDYPFFNIPKAEALSTDPQQRIFLEVAYEAFHYAGLNKERLQGSSTGVFVGQMNYDWMMDFNYTKEYAGTGSAPSITSNRISYIFDLLGPSITVDTACSSSLVALDLAVTKLRNGSCDLALAGGINLILSPEPYLTTCQARMLSPDSRCATFDAAANGIARGEGAGAVVLKRLSDAEADGDQILAVIRGSAVNQDGHSASLTAPSGLSQEAVINSALNMAGINGSDIDYVECHGTGTPLGDPIEVEALKNVLGPNRKKPIILGSVKTNIGHLEGAAGITGLIKTVLVLQNRVAPGNIHFKSLNPKIDLESFPAIIDNKARALGNTESNTPLLAGVSSFGYGGTNAHVILESHKITPSANLLTSPKTLWMFTGQGSLTPGCAKSLFENNTFFKEALIHYNSVLKEKLDLHIIELLINPKAQKGGLLNLTQYGQPAIVALQLAQAYMWEVNGNKPGTVIGHSIGELAAAVVAGVMESEEALRLSQIRGQLMSKCPEGSMAAVFASEENFQSLPDNIYIAAKNSPQMTVLSGEKCALTSYLKNSLSSINHTMLPVSHAFHSPFMEKAADLFLSQIDKAKLSIPKDVQFISTSTGKSESSLLQTAEYWSNQITQPVEFYAAIKSAMSQSISIDTIAEIGPSPTLINVAKNIISDETVKWIPPHEAQLHVNKRHLFETRNLPWDKPSAKKNFSKTYQPSDKDHPENCIYETRWTPTNLKPHSIPLSQTVILSRLPFHNIPQKGEVKIVEMSSELPINSLNSNSTIALISHGSEDDVEIGFMLLQTINSIPSLNSKNIIFVTKSNSSVDAGLWALARTFRLERPDIRIQCVLCSGDRVYDALSVSSLDENECLIDSQGTICVPRLQKCTDIDFEAQLSLNSNATYLISGGQGALGLVAAKLLVERGAKHIFLLSRHPKPLEEISELKELNKKANISCFGSDVTSEQSLLQAKEWLSKNKWPEVMGIIHAAGVLTDGMLSNQSIEKLHIAYNTKVHGAYNLKKVFSSQDFFVLFSSAAAAFGSVGQASYAAANAALDALAQKWSQEGENALSIQWGAWSDDGMAVRSNAVQRIEASGFGSISNALGMKILELLLASSKKGVVCASPIDRNILNLKESQFELPHEKNLEEPKKKWTQIEVTTLVRDTILQFLPQDKVEGNPSFMEAGFSSLDLVQLRQKLLDNLPKCVDLPVHFAFNYPTEKDVVDYILEQIELESTIFEKEETWIALNDCKNGPPLFLISGVIGSVEKTFGTLAKALPIPVYAARPEIPAIIDLNSITLEKVAKDLKNAILQEVPCNSYTIGGLSFGGTLAIEIGLQLEREQKLDRLIMIDPRHVPPFTAPEHPAPFEILLEHYKPSGTIKAPVTFFQSKIPPIEKQSEMMIETSRSFQNDSDALNQCRKLCPNLEVVLSEGHHFNLLYKYADSIADQIMKDFGTQSNPSFTVQSQNSNEPIAIVSTACRLPGNVFSSEDFWDMLSSQTDCVSEIPLSRFDIDSVYDKDPNAAGYSYTRHGAFMERVEYFDFNFFGLSIAEAKVMDPQQRLILEVAFEAFSQAGFTKETLRTSPIGVYIGLANDDWTTMGRKKEAQSPYFGAGVSGSIASNRISYLLGLTGPSMTIDTACSSSLVAIDLAVDKLRAGRCSAALVGGVNVMLHSRMFVSACATKALSPKGRCATFDAFADGYCRGEGVGAVVLKRLSDAISDGNQILAVIRGTAVNQDGRSVSMTAPNGLAQEAVIKGALSVAGLNGSDVDYVECHGTGTPLGDPIEVGALKNVLSPNRRKPVVLGAVKSNIGHLEGAAGIIGLIKAVEVLKHRRAPSLVHFKALNPKIDLKDFYAILPTYLIPLPTSGSIIAGVSSFGFGGTNAHVVLESYNQKSGPLPQKPTYIPHFLPWNRLPHPLLGYKKKSRFEAKLIGEKAKMWEDHQIQGDVLIPAASHITMLGGAALLDSKIAIEDCGIELKEVTMTRPLILKGEDQNIRCLTKDQRLVIEEEQGDVIKEVASCHSTSINIRPKEAHTMIDPQEICDRCTAIDLEDSYAILSNQGIKFGLKYRNLHSVYLGQDEAIARIELKNLTSNDLSLTLLNPAALDAGIQLLGIYGINICGVCIPFHIRSVRLFAVDIQPKSFWAYAKIISSTSKSIEGTITLFNDEGEVFAILEDLTCRHLAESEPLTEDLFETEWIKIPQESESESLSLNPFLVVSQQELDITFSNDWKKIEACHDKELTSILDPTFSNIILISSGLESDVEFGISLLQHIASGGAAHIQKVVFLTQPKSCDDAGLWGLARTFRLENSEVKILSIECPLDNLLSSLPLILNKENEYEFSVDSKGSVFISRLKRHINISHNPNIPIHPNETFIISGGHGSLGLVCAKFLVEHGATHLVLLSRNPKSIEEIPEIAVLRKSATVQSLPCDVSKEASIKEVGKFLKTNNWPIVGGIFHTAGVLTDGTFTNQSVEKLHLAYKAKVHGARNLRNLLTPKHFFVLFSSAASTFGSAGQASYAAANATLDALAQKWSQEGERVLSIQWGAWSDGGMAVRHDAVKRAEAAGFGSISNTLGTNVLKKLLAERAVGTICVSPINWNILNLEIPLISRFRKKSLYRPKIEGTNRDDQFDQKQILVIVRQAVSEAIGKSVDDDAPLMASGLDSLSAVVLAQSLSKKLDLSLGAIFALNYPSIEEMVKALAPMVQKNVRPIENVPVVVETKQYDKAEPIAIVSTACRLPGNVSSPDEFWEMLQNGTDCVSEIPISRFDIDEVYDPNPDAIGTSYTRKGAFISKAENFDYEFFGISASEARAMDPQQRLLLEVAYEAFHVAGYDKKRLKGSSAGVFVGVANQDWTVLNGDLEAQNPYFGVGVSTSIMSNRISHVLGLTGPSMTIDTACSSSLVALDLAVEKLRNSTCSMALVGGVNLMMHYRTFVGCCAAKMLSMKGRCASFDETADGYCRGEGVGAVVLKRLSDASADGDSILAVIRGTAVNQDGLSATLTAPNGPAQEAVINQALSIAGIEGASVDYIECHGTGTALGDPIEVSAIKNVLGKDRKKTLILGAIKSNIGHLEGAAGIVGLIKAVQVLRHRQVPKIVHFNTLNPKIDLSDLDATFPKQTISLPSNGPLIASVSSFGFGGTNAHAVLESFTSLIPSTQSKPPYVERFLPWRRLPNPLLIHKGENGFEAHLSGKKLEMWNDHNILGEIYIPASSHISMLGGAYLIKNDPLSNELGVQVNEITMTKPYVLKKNGDIIHCNSSGNSWNIKNKVGESFATCQSISFITNSGEALSDLNPEIIIKRCTETDMEEVYQNLSTQGMQFGPTFKNLKDVYLGNQEAIACVELDELFIEDLSLSLLHPRSLDAGIQLLALLGMNSCGLCIPFYVHAASLFYLQKQPKNLWAFAQVNNSDSSNIEGTVTLFSETGKVFAVLRGLTCRSFDPARSQIIDSLYETEWIALEEQPQASSQRNGTILSTQPINTDLPKSWEMIIIDEEQEIPSTLFTSNSNITLFSHGLEKDVELGLKLLRKLNILSDSIVSDVTFITKPSSYADAGLWGLARTFRLERPDIHIQCIYCETNQLNDALLLPSLDEDEFSFDNHANVKVPRLRSCKDVSLKNGLLLEEKATYVISGGQGALGLVAAKLLVEQGAKYLLLLSRNPKSIEEVPELMALSHKATISSFAADISDLKDLTRAKEWLSVHDWPIVNGIIHTAGALTDGTFSNQSTEKLRFAYEAKVHGAYNLREVFAPEDFFVLFSSAAATFGSAGQASYAAANATLDALAQKWSEEGERVLSIQWGAWSEAGMATRHDAVKRAEAAGFGSISNVHGSKILELLLSSSKKGAILASPIDWSKISINTPLLTSFQNHRITEDFSEESTLQGKYSLDQIVAIVRHAVNEAVGKPTEDDAPLMASGLDSLNAVILAQTLSKKLGLTLGGVFVLNHPTIQDMSAALLPLTEKKAKITKQTLPVVSVQIAPSKEYTQEPIAVVSSACRLPGSVFSPEDFWDMLQNGTDCVSDIPASRFNINEVYDPNPDAIGRSYTRRGAFMEEVENFDYDFFNIPISEARAMDPQQRLMLEVAYEAFDGAGYNKKSLKGTATGIFIGQMNHDWAHLYGATLLTDPYFGAGSAASIMSNRISYLLGLTGPSMTLDTACSSSLVAVDLAVEKLQRGSCSIALVGGVHVMLSSRSFVGCCAAKMLSFKGRCATFDESADGYCRGEGVGAVVLKRLSDALKDNNQILSIIRGTAVNQDGRSASLTAPYGPAQEAVINSALNMAGINGSDIDYVECHGTGTPLGDPIEVAAIKNVMVRNRKKPIVLGAVKSNIGHLEGAAGIIGLIKAIEVLRHRQVPKNVHFNTLNPKIDLKNFEAIFPTKLTLLPTTGPLFAGVSSFGFGGTNAHVILESWNSSSNNHYINRGRNE